MRKAGAIFARIEPQEAVSTSRRGESAVLCCERRQTLSHIDSTATEETVREARRAGFGCLLGR